MIEFIHKIFSFHLWREWVILIFCIIGIISIHKKVKKEYLCILAIILLGMWFSIDDFYQYENFLGLAQEKINNSEYIDAQIYIDSAEDVNKLGGTAGSKYNIDEMKESIHIPLMYEQGCSCERNQEYNEALKYFLECEDYLDAISHIKNCMENMLMDIKYGGIISWKE